MPPRWALLRECARWPETLLKGARVVVTMDDADTELADADLLIRDGVIVAVGQGLARTGAVHDLSGCDRHSRSREHASPPFTSR